MTLCYSCGGVARAETARVLVLAEPPRERVLCRDCRTEWPASKQYIPTEWPSESEVRIPEDRLAEPPEGGVQL